MKLVIEHSAAGKLNFQSNLYKMQRDHLNFEKFEELFDEEDEVFSDEPIFDDEWRRCQVSN